MRDVLPRVTALYAQIDQQVRAFQLKTGLRCLAGCGACCLTADVHASILEMLPAAHEILCQGAAAFWLEQIEAHKDGGICVFYQNERKPEALGHCGLYAFRPTVCRLFGFASVRTRSGTHEVSICRQVKQASPKATVTARDCRAEAPCLSDVGLRLNSLDISTGVRLMPINEALGRAILRLGLKMQLVQSERLGVISAA